MAAPSSCTSSITLPYVGKPLDPPGTTLMFCNGIMNDLDNAKASASVISQAFGGRQVFVYHNPTTCSDYFETTEEKIMRQMDLSTSLADKIHDFILSDRKTGIKDHEICIILFAHSHGAIVTNRALAGISGLDQTHQNKIKVYAFGGAIMIPKSLASKVYNFVFNEDVISLAASVRPENMVSYHVQRIFTIMKEKGVNRETAITLYAYEDLLRELHPLNRSTGREDPETKKNKDQRYRQIFVLNSEETLSSDSFFLGRITNYITYFNDYNITILEGTPFVHPEYSEIREHANLGEFADNLPTNLTSILENVFKALTAFGSHALANHQFSAYEPVVQRIARGDFS